MLRWCGQRAAGSGQRAAGSGQRAAGSGQRAAGSGQRAVGWVLCASVGWLGRVDVVVAWCPTVGALWPPLKQS
ncbi:MAG: hypothetical protein ABSA93_33240 [Streptosporangiaceae bacterium]